MRIPNIYAKPYYKYYILISIAIGILALMALPGIQYGIDLRGGTQITAVLNQEMADADLAPFFAQYELEDLSVRFTHNPLNDRHSTVVEFTGTTDLLQAESLIESDPQRAIALATPFVSGNVTDSMTAREVVELAKTDFNREVQDGLVAHLGITNEDVTTTEIGAALGQQFWESSQRALLLAFILIVIIVFILFREPVPSIAVIQAAAYDILIALAGMAVFQIPITIPTIAGLLMILGHSVDTDILTTDRVLKRKEGTAADRAYGAMITGITMTGTMLIVLAVLVLFSHFNQMTTLNQIALVLLFGLLGDLPSSWCTNTVMIKWWAERKKK